MNMSRSFRRTAQYAKELAEIAQKQHCLNHIIQREQERANFEAIYAHDLNRAYELIEKHAKQGAIRIFENNATYRKEDEDVSVLFKDPIKNYLMSQGFQYTYNTIEWWNIEKELK